MLLNLRELPNLGLATETERLSALIGDMKRLQRGVAPEALADVDVPILDQWKLTARPVSSLSGRSSGHPGLGGINPSTGTSDPWILTEDRGWARTLSRWYRMGPPAGLTDMDS